MAKIKVVVELEGGLISNISSTEDIEVTVVDRDIEGADADEVFSKDELKEIASDEEWINIQFKGGISDEEIPLRFKE